MSTHEFNLSLPDSNDNPSKKGEIEINIIRFSVTMYSNYSVKNIHIKIFIFKCLKFRRPHDAILSKVRLLS